MDSVPVTWYGQAGFRLAHEHAAAILLPARARPVTLALP